MQNCPQWDMHCKEQGSTAGVFPVNLISGYWTCSMEHPRGTFSLEAQKFLKHFYDYFSFL